MRLQREILERDLRNNILDAYLEDKVQKQHFRDKRQTRNSSILEMVAILDIEFRGTEFQIQAADF